jgi:threonine dehydrogenase-like Zn-dependent dehydrogenase
MKALVRFAPEAGSLRVQDMPDPTPEPGKVVLKVAACGICGTDVRDRRADKPDDKPYPYVIGHEFAGTVAQLGGGVNGFAVGDAVATEPFAVWCGRCAMCRAGRVNNCRQHSDMGFGVHGGMADYALVPARGLHRLPDSVDPGDGAILEPVAVSYNALFAEGNVNPADFVVVLGCGPIGLLCASLALAAGAEVLLTGRTGNEFRMDAARAIGVQHVVNVSEADPLAAVSALAEPDGPDLVVDATGGTEAFGQALRMASMCGRVVKVGWFHAGGDAALNTMVAKNLRVHGVYGHTYPVWEKSVRVLTAGLIPLDHIVTARLPLERWEDGFRLMDARAAVKVLLQP